METKVGLWWVLDLNFHLFEDISTLRRCRVKERGTETHLGPLGSSCDVRITPTILESETQV